MNCKKKPQKTAFRIAIFRPATGNRLVFFFFGLTDEYCTVPMDYSQNTTTSVNAVNEPS